MTEANAFSESTFGVMVCHVWVIAFREIKTEDKMLKAKPNKAMTGEFWQFKEGKRLRQAKKRVSNDFSQGYLGIPTSS